MKVDIWALYSMAWTECCLVHLWLHCSSVPWLEPILLPFFWGHWPVPWGILVALHSAPPAAPLLQSVEDVFTAVMTNGERRPWVWNMTCVWRKGMLHCCYAVVRHHRLLLLSLLCCTFRNRAWYSTTYSTRHRSNHCWRIRWSSKVWRGVYKNAPLQKSATFWYIAGQPGRRLVGRASESDHKGPRFEWRH